MNIYNINLINLFSNIISCENSTIQTFFIFSTKKSKKQTKRNILKKLQLKKYYKCKTDDTYCTICCENIKEKEYVRELQCNHKYHKRCVDRWLITCVNELEDIFCPLCRKKIEWY